VSKGYSLTEPDMLSTCRYAEQRAKGMPKPDVPTHDEMQPLTGPPLEEDEVTGFVGPGAHEMGDLLDLCVW